MNKPILTALAGEVTVYAAGIPNTNETGNIIQILIQILIGIATIYKIIKDNKK